jgi:hypothetical protein
MLVMQGVSATPLREDFMVHPKHWLKFLGFALILSVLVACDQGSNPASSVSGEMEDSVGWTIGNIPTNFWADGSGPSAVIDLSVTFKDSSIEATDIDNVEITNSLSPTKSWNYTADRIADYFFISLSSGKKRLGFPGLWTDTANGSVIYLGVYTVEVKLKNGKRSTKSLVTPAPSALTANGYSYIYSPEDYVGTPPSDYIALPKRATIGAVALDATGGSLTINFSVNDDKIYSGWILFFDENKKYLGAAGDFQDFSARTVYPKLNNGLEFRTNGVSNTLALTTADINVSSQVSNFTLSMIKSFRIIMTDGKQYLGTDSSYDTYSVSVGTVSN